MCFLVGCSLVAFGNEESVLRFLPSANALFLAGSALLLVDSLVVLWSHRRRCIFFDKLPACCCCHDDNDEGDNCNANANDSAHYGIGSLVIAVSFVFAGILGGYGESSGEVRTGMFGWLIGSVVGLLETIPELYQRYSGRGCSRPCESQSKASGTCCLQKT
jgi:hypothetical protein